MTDLYFPSEDHRRALIAKVEAGGLKALDDPEKREFHAYRYAWRRVRFADFTQKYGADPNGDWFDGVFVNEAVTFYTDGCGLPSRQQHRPDPTPEDVAYVETRLVQFRANLAAAEERNRAAVARHVADPRDLAAIQAGLGLTATESNREQQRGRGWPRRCGVKSSPIRRGHQ
jgi:hypothetical protein